MATAKPDITTNGIWGSTGATTDPGATKTQTGWIGEIPPSSVQNWWQERADQFLSHLNEQGIAEWDALTDYPVAGWAKGSDGELYKSLQTPNVGQDPISTPAFWTLIETDGAIAQATEILIGGGKIATNAIALAGVNDTDIMTALKTKALIDQELGSIAIFEDQKASGTDGGTFTSGAWQTRTLNTTATNNISGASLSLNQVTLPVGTYHISIAAVALDVQGHSCKLRNITDSTDEFLGSSQDTTGANNIGTNAICEGLVTIAGTKVFEVQHRGSATRSTKGFGQANTFGVNELYCRIIINKVS